MDAKEKVVEYVMETPGNTNKNVLRSLLDDVAEEASVGTSSSSSGLIVELDAAGALINSQTQEKLTPILIKEAAARGVIMKREPNDYGYIYSTMEYMLDQEGGILTIYWASGEGVKEFTDIEPDGDVIGTV